jgi:hypothetical protein
MEREENCKSAKSLHFCAGIFVSNYVSIFEIMFAMFFKFRIYILATFLFAGSSQPIDDSPEPARKKNKGKKTHPEF